MGKGFDRLAVGGLTVGAASMALGGVAEAVTLATPVTVVAGGLTYDISNSATGFSYAAMGIDDVTQTAPPSYTSTFLGAHLFATDTNDYEDPDGNVKLGSNVAGTKVKGSPDFDGLIKRNYKLTLFSGVPVARLEAIVKNTGLAQRTVTFDWDSALADADPATAGTEDGNLSIGAGDSWIIVDQDDADSEGDVLFGRGDGWNAPVAIPDADSALLDTRDIVLDAGEKARVTVFIRIGNSPVALAAVASDFNGSDLPEFYKGGMSVNARAQTVNCNLS